MNKCAIYVRVSTALGKQDYTRQISELTAIAKSHGFKDKNIVEYADSISGYKFEERDELNNLLNKIRENPKLYDCIYISEISRLGRKPRNTRNIIEELIDLKVPIYVQSLNQKTIDEKGERNGYISVSLQLMLEIADMEAATFKLRSRSGRIQKVKEGKVGGGKYYPYGYKKGEDKLLVLDEDELEVIKKIFNLYSDGFGVKAISHILNAEGIPTRSKKSFPDQSFNYNTPKKGEKVIWSDKQIHDIIRNPIYKGKRRFLGEYYDAPSIVSEELFDRCNHTLKNKSNRNSYKEYIYLFKGILTCGVCGRNYAGRFKPGLKGEKVYKCSSTLVKGGSCSNAGINIELIESIVFNIIVESSKAIDLITKQENLYSDVEKQLVFLESKFINSEKDIQTNLKKRENLLQFLIGEDISVEEYRKSKTELDKLITDLQLEITTLQKKINEKKHTLSELNKPDNAKKTLASKSSDRNYLFFAFKQLIHKIIVNQINKDYFLLTIFFKIGNEVLKVPLKMLIDVSSYRKRKKTIKFTSLFQMEFEPYYRNGILDTEKDLILDEFLSNINIFNEWEEISEDKIIRILNN
jgi:DNA invertase Pin-like site-specific DNA recombinase